MINPIVNTSSFVNTIPEREYENLPSWEKIVDIACRIFHAISFILFCMIPHFIAYVFCRSSSYVSPDETPIWKENSEGLFVFTTGLFGHPVWAAPYLAQIEREMPNADVKIPYIPHEGNCSLDEAANPIAKMVKDYIRKHPRKPVCIIGTSNGGRIAAKVSELCRQEEVSMFVASLAGVFFGIPDIEPYKKQSSIHKTIISDFTFGSEPAKSLIHNMRRPMIKGSRHFEFYVGSQENLLTRLSSCLPILGHGERHKVLSGYDHMTITEGAREEVLRNAFNWMKKQ